MPQLLCPLFLPQKFRVVAVLLHGHRGAIWHVVQAIICSIIQRLSYLIFPRIIWNLVVCLHSRDHVVMRDRRTESDEARLRRRPFLPHICYDYRNDIKSFNPHTNCKSSDAQHWPRCQAFPRSPPTDLSWYQTWLGHVFCRVISRSIIFF